MAICVYIHIHNMDIAYTRYIQYLPKYEYISTYVFNCFIVHSKCK